MLESISSQKQKQKEFFDYLNLIWNWIFQVKNARRGKIRNVMLNEDEIHGSKNEREDVNGKRK